MPVLRFVTYIYSLIFDVVKQAQSGTYLEEVHKGRIGMKRKAVKKGTPTRKAVMHSPEAEAYTMPIPRAGKVFFGAERGAAYRMARLGVIPTVLVGRRRRLANVRAIKRRLAEESATG